MLSWSVLCCRNQAVWRRDEGNKLDQKPRGLGWMVSKYFSPTLHPGGMDLLQVSRKFPCFRLKFNTFLAMINNFHFQLADIPNTELLVTFYPLPYPLRVCIFAEIVCDLTPYGATHDQWEQKLVDKCCPLPFHSHTKFKAHSSWLLRSPNRIKLQLTITMTYCRTHTLLVFPPAP